MEHDLLDVNFLKLVDWLVDRKQVPSDWRKRLQAIQLKLAEVVKRLPEQLSTLGDNATDYASAKAVRNKLAETADKNIFGYLTGEAGVWDKLVRAYEKDNIYLGEAALVLVRNGEFEIPYLKSLIAKQQGLLIDYEKKQAEYQKSATVAAREYKQDCQALGIVGTDVEKELAGLTDQLPQLLKDAAEGLQAPEVVEAMQYYQDFTAYSASKGEENVAASRESSQQLLPTLLELQTSPLELPVDTSFGTSLPADDRSQEEVDWGVEVSAEVSDATIIEWPADAEPGSATINWDIDVSSPAEEMNWDVSEEQGGELAEGSAVREEASGSNSPPQGILERLIQDSGYRTQAIIELCELRAFLRQRSTEMEMPAYQNLITVAPEAIQQVGLPAVQKMLQAVQGCWGALTAERIKQLLALKTSQRYFQRTVAALQQQADKEGKFYRLAREVEGRRQELQQTIVENAPKLADLKERTAQTKVLVESSLSSLLNGRKVQIIGEINNVLQ